MSKTRKILSVVLALVMVFSVLSVSASAAANYETAEDLAEFGYNQVWEIKEDENDGSESIVTVNVYLTTNYPTGSIQFVVNNTNPAAAVLDYENVALGSGITYAAEIKANANGKVLIVPETTADTVTAPTLDNALVATLKYTVGTGSATLTIKDDEKTAETPAGTLIAARMDDGDIVTGNPVVGQPATVTGEVNIGATAAAPELVAIDGTFGVVDNAAGWVYGIDAINGETVEDVFEVTNGGYFETSYDTATGSVLTVYTADGEEVAEYTIIVFGDVNADGAIDSADAGFICDFEAMALESFEEFGISDDLALIAGDITGEGACDAEDAGIICDYEAMAIDTLMDLAAVCEAVYSYNN